MNVDNLLTTFERYLEAQNLSKNTINTYICDINHYLSEKNCVKNFLDSEEFIKVISKKSLLNYFLNTFFYKYTVGQKTQKIMFLVIWGK